MKTWYGFITDNIIQGDGDQMTIFEMVAIQLIFEILEWNKRQFVVNEGKFYWYIKFLELYR